MQCTIYTRVSTDNQVEKEYNSCQSQEEKIRSFINSQEEMKVFKVYSDPGFTGANLERPGLQEMLKDIRDSRFRGNDTEEGGINFVIVYKMDRLTRSPALLSTVCNSKLQPATFLNIKPVLFAAFF